MPRYRLLAIDIDGTLVNSRHELSERTRQAVLRARAAGLEIVLATGVALVDRKSTRLTSSHKGASRMPAAE